MQVTVCSRFAWKTSVIQLPACACLVFCSIQMSPFWQSAGDFILRSLFSAGIAVVILRLIGQRWLTAVEAKHARGLEDLRAQYATDLQHSKQLLQSRNRQDISRHQSSLRDRVSGTQRSLRSLGRDSIADAQLATTDAD